MEDSPKLVLPWLTVTLEVVVVGAGPKDSKIGSLRDPEGTLDLVLQSTHLYDPAGIIPRGGDILRARERSTKRRCGCQGPGSPEVTRESGSGSGILAG